MNFPYAVPVEHRTDVFTWIFVGVAFFAGLGAGFMGRAHTITHTHLVKQSVQAQYGKPSQSIDGAQLNASLKGLTCDVFQKAQVILCHR